MELEALVCIGESVEVLYDTIEKMFDVIDKTQEQNRKYLIKLIETSNRNVELVNDRMNNMDLDIEIKDREQSDKRLILSDNVDKVLKEERKKNGTYKTDITKRFNKFKKENEVVVTQEIGIIEVDRNNKNKEMIIHVRQLEEEVKQNKEDLKKYKEHMVKIIIAVKTEMKIRSRKHNTISIK